jgi:AbrB family looped-hinge helix DNA binding protein
MAIKVSLDEGGGIVIPKSVLDALRLKPGCTLEIERQDDVIVVRRHRSSRSRAVASLIGVDHEDRIHQLIRRRPIREEDAE